MIIATLALLITMIVPPDALQVGSVYVKCPTTILTVTDYERANGAMYRTIGEADKPPKLLYVWKPGNDDEADEIYLGERQLTIEEGSTPCKFFAGGV